MVLVQREVWIMYVCPQCIGKVLAPTGVLFRPGLVYTLRVRIRQVFVLYLLDECPCVWDSDDIPDGFSLTVVDNEAVFRLEDIIGPAPGKGRDM